MIKGRFYAGLAFFTIEIMYLLSLFFVSTLGSISITMSKSAYMTIFGGILLGGLNILAIVLITTGLKQDN